MVLWAAIFFKICDDWIEKWWSACRMSTPQKWSSQISGLQCFHFTQLARNLHQGYTYKAAGTRYSKQPPCSGNKACDLNLVFHVDATWQLQRRICKATRLCQFIWLQHRSWPDHLLKLYICKKKKNNFDNFLLKLRQSDTESDVLDSILHCQFLFKSMLDKGSVSVGSS